MSAAPSKMIDLRSDTVTQPTAEMRAAMAAAVVGDDVFDDDPTVHQLQQRVAQLLGKEAALYVPSGTMGNLICCMVHCDARDSEIILGSDSHIHLYEGGGSATLGHIHSRTVPNKLDGTMDLAEIEKLIRGVDDHFPVTKLICLENTHNRCSGAVLPTSYVDSVGELARRYGVRLHIDGARLVNAAVFLKEDPKRMVQAADSVSFCLSKGLAAPVGSVIVGSKDFIRRARRVRKALGGGMRQAGTIAAAGLVAVNNMFDRVSEDHANAQTLAVGLSKIAGLVIEPSRIQTNIVFVDVNTAVAKVTANQIRDRLKNKFHILAVATSETRMRFVTHYMIAATDIPAVLDAMAKCVAA